MCILHCSSLFIVFCLLVITSLPKNLFFVDDVAQSKTLNLIDANFNFDASSSNDFILNTNFDDDNINLFNFSLEDDLNLDNSLTFVQSQNSFQANNNFLNELQGRDTDHTSTCDSSKNGPAQLNLPLDLFTNSTEFLLRGKLIDVSGYNRCSQYSSV